MCRSSTTDRLLGVPVIRSILSLCASPGNSIALEELYAQRGILEKARKFAGCRDAVLLRSVADGPVTHLVLADWDDADAYQRWVDDPWRAAVSLQLADLLESETGAPIVGGLFEPVPAAQRHPPRSSEE
jgi:heme-degrading monooxygenase HmoA